MSLADRPATSKRQTIADEVFEYLRNEIISLNIEPGTHLSEAEVAKKFEVSRQPVREAFLRLGDLDLLLIRPQKATLVKKISLAEIAHTRFIRAAVEVEVVRVASQVASAQSIEALRESLRLQANARNDGDPVQLRLLDYDFHRLICEAAKQPNAFTVVSEFKAHTDRICRIELDDAEGMAETVDGHTRIVEAIAGKDATAAAENACDHLAHLDSTLQSAQDKFPQYFEL